MISSVNEFFTKMTLWRKRGGWRSQKDSAVRVNHNNGRFTKMNNIWSTDTKSGSFKKIWIELENVLGAQYVIRKAYSTYYIISSQAAKLHGLGNVGQLRFHTPRHSIEDAHPSTPMKKCRKMFPLLINQRLKEILLTIPFEKQHGFRNLTWVHSKIQTNQNKQLTIKIFSCIWNRNKSQDLYKVEVKKAQS